jgi:putative transposase
MKVHFDGPDDVFGTQQARNIRMELADRATPVTLLIRGRNTTFVSSFGAVLAAEGIRIINIPVRTPRANAERFVGTV